MLSAVVNDVFVNLIGNRQHVPLLAEVPDDLKLLAAKHLSGWIIGRINNDSFRLVVERCRKFLLVERPIRSPELDVSWRRAGNNGIWSVILVERFENDDLVAGVDHGQEHIDHRFGRAARHSDLPLWVDVDTEKLLRLINQRIAEVLRSPRN